MSKESLEHLSSLMDGELSRETGLFMTRRLSSDEKLCETWERYHLIRDCIRQPGSKRLITGLSERISESLEEDVTVQPARNLRRWLKPLSGLAVAASVALMAIVVTAPPTEVQPGSGEPALSGSANQPFVSPNTLRLAPVSQAVSYTSGQQTHSNRLNAYLLRHNQMARTAGRQGFVSFVPIVATSETAGAKKSEGEPEAEKSPADSEPTENR